VYGTNNHYGSNGGEDYDDFWPYSSPVGGNQPHNNMPPYMCVFYIQKFS
jgi:microcystin-dependent protein